MWSVPLAERYQPSDQPAGRLGGEVSCGTAVHVLPSALHAGTTFAGAFGNAMSSGELNCLTAVPSPSATAIRTALVPAAKPLEPARVLVASAEAEIVSFPGASPLAGQLTTALPLPLTTVSEPALPLVAVALLLARDGGVNGAV